MLYNILYVRLAVDSLRVATVSSTAERASLTAACSLPCRYNKLYIISIIYIILI